MDVFALTMRLKEEGAATVKASMDKLGRSFAGATTSATKMDSATISLAGAMRTLAASFGARELAQMSDSYTNMNSRLGLVTKSTEQQVRVQAQLFALAQETRTPFEDIVNLYTKTANAATALNLSQEQVLLVTSQTAKAVALSGSTAAEAAAAIQQLGQAFGNGAVQAQEYTSLAEQTPRLARAIAESFGITTAELRKAVLAGRLNSQELAKAILQNKELAKEFAKLPTTISGAFTQLRNQVLLFVGELNKGTGAAESFVKFITALKNNLPLVASILVTVTAAYVAYRTVLFTVAAAEMAVATAAAFASGNLVKGALAVGGAAATVLVFSKTLSSLQEMMTGVTTATSSLAVAEGGLPPKLAASNKEAKTQVELMQELAALVPITYQQAAILTREEERLKKALQAKQLPFEKEVELTEKLVGVRESLASATVSLTEKQLRNVERMMSPGIGAVNSIIGPSTSFQVSPIVEANARAAYKQITEKFQANIVKENEQLGAFLQQDLQNTLYDSLIIGIETALQKGANIKDAFGALGATLLSGIGSVMINFGKSLIPLGALMTKLRESFLALSGPGMIAAGIGFIAIGAALRGAAGRAMQQGGGGSGGGNVGGYSAPAMPSNMTMPTNYYAPTSAGSANTIEQINPISVTIIGPNDPTAQRQMQELLRNAQRRGNV